MKIILSIVGGILALTCIAAVTLTSHAPGVPSSPTSSYDLHTLTPLPGDLSQAEHSVPDEVNVELPGGITSGPQSDGTCIHCGPGDDVCKAAGDCGYGDNPGSKDDGIPNNNDH